MQSPSAPNPAASRRPLGVRGPRGDILVQLKRTPDLTARDLGRVLGYSLNGVRHHLKELEAEGLVEYQRRHHGVGAPMFVYRLAPGGEALFPRRYEATLLEFLDQVVATDGREAAVRVLETQFTNLATKLGDSLAGASPQRRLEVVTAALSDQGYMAEWQEQHNGSFATLTEHNCAVKAVAERFPELCQAEARFLETVLGNPVERRAHMLTGCGACEYLVRLAPATEVKENA
jgi:DeoR family transcriptional regulator, suf operon transcriptional repressor